MDPCMKLIPTQSYDCTCCILGLVSPSPLLVPLENSVCVQCINSMYHRTLAPLYLSLNTKVKRHDLHMCGMYNTGYELTRHRCGHLSYNTVHLRPVAFIGYYGRGQHVSGILLIPFPSTSLSWIPRKETYALAVLDRDDLCATRLG